MDKSPTLPSNTLVGKPPPECGAPIRQMHGDAPASESRSQPTKN
jgi:hypothetical protein